MHELKARVADLAVSTDVIVGFPGETERDFGESVKLAEDVGFSKLHVFKFSPRKGTPAAGFNSQIPGDIKERRSAELIEVGKKLSAQFAANYIGKTLSVLIERVQGKYLSGVSSNYIRVYCEGPQDRIGKLATVSITGQEETFLYGKVI